MSRRPRLTVRARLTLLSTGLFAVCGAIVVAVSYVLVARLAPAGQSQKAPASFVALCRSPHPNARILGKCDAYFQLQGEKDQHDVTLSHLLEYSLITLAVVLVIAAILGWIVAGRALRPVHLITAAARAASERNLSARVALRGPRDELTELAETFDEMLDRLQAAFEGQQRFIANASHELRTPLAVMRATVDVVLDNPQSTPADLRGMAADVRGAIEHAEHLIGALLILARNERGLAVHEQVDLATAAEDVLDSVDAGNRRVHAELEPAVISGDPVLAERLVANLVDNAIRYNADGGEIWISTRTVDGSSELTVANTGPAVGPADADRIFQPFQRLDDRTSHEGSGLGLAIVASIAAIHGGTVTARPREQGGLTITVTIPSAAPPPSGRIRPMQCALREVRDEDLAAMFEQWADPVAAHMAAFIGPDHMDRDAFERRWARLRADETIINRAIVVDGEVAGTIGSWGDPGEREVTYWIGRAYWGKGIATCALEAFLAVDESRPIHARIAYDNVASQRVLEKCGFRVVGTDRGFAEARSGEIEELVLRLDQA